MKRVLCSLPFASEEISGVAFAPVEGGMLSEEISDEAAEGFALVPGYSIVEGQQPAAETNTDGAGEGAAQTPAKQQPKRKAH